MSTLEKDGLEARLFSRRDRKLVNIKFMRGTAKVIAADDLCRAVANLVDQSTYSTSSAAVKSGRPAINVRNLIADL